VRFAVVVAGDDVWTANTLNDCSLGGTLAKGFERADDEIRKESMIIGVLAIG
jgi:hypothetical protein